MRRQFNSGPGGGDGEVRARTVGDAVQRGQGIIMIGNGFVCLPGACKILNNGVLLS